jgi:septal ring factor EnvC (AmiA/AmiB activator)
MSKLKPAYYIINVLIISVLLFIINGYSQTKEELREKRKQKLKEIEYTNDLINKTERKQQSAMNKLLIINKRLSIREELIESLTNEIQSIDNQINGLETIIKEKRNKIQQIKNDYSNIIYNTYKHYNSYNRLMFLLSADNFNQAYKRLKYIKQYADYRKKQVEKLKELNQELKNKQATLKQTKENKLDLLAEKKEEKQQFEHEKKERRALIANLKDREQELKEDLMKKRRIAQQLEEEIQRIIERETKEQENIFAKLTPEEKLVSKNFEKNKGRLPWPTERGIITEEFGRHKHPVLSGVYVNNNGIDITTIGGSEVRALFQGEVTKIIAIKGANNTIIIRHGNFLSVYQNVVDVNVKTGEHVDTKETIGYVYKEDDQKESVLHIEIWKETQKLNPKEWLANR